MRIVMPGAIISASRIGSPRVQGTDRPKANQKGRDMATAQERITVLSVDDHELARQGLHRMLELENDLEVVGEASNAEEALERVAALTPDVILMDINMPMVNGLEATRMLKESRALSRVIILGLHQEFLAQAFEAGAGGYLTKDMKREDLVSAIRRVSKGEVVVASDLLASPDLISQALKSFHDNVQRTAQSVLPQTPASQPAEAPAATDPVPTIQEDESLPNPTALPPTPVPAAPDIGNHASPQSAVNDYPPSPQTSRPQAMDAPATPLNVEVPLRLTRYTTFQKTVCKQWNSPLAALSRPRNGKKKRS